MNSVHKWFFFILFICNCVLTSLGCSRTLISENHVQLDAVKPLIPRIVFSTWSAANRKGIVEGIQRYNEQNKDHVAVELMDIPFDRYIEKLNVLFSSGQGPDVSGISSEWVEPYMQKNWIADMSSQVDASFFEKFPKWAVDMAKRPVYKNRFYSIPASQITFRLIYNKELFERAGLDPQLPPATFNQLVDYANRIGENERGRRKYGFALAAGEEWGGYVQALEVPCTYSGVFYYNNINRKYDLSGYLPFFEGIQRMKNGRGLFPNEMLLKTDSAKLQFAEGNIGMMYASNWDISFFLYQVPLNFQVGIAFPPVLDEGKEQGILAIVPGVCYVVNSKTQQKEEAENFWRYLYSKSNMDILYNSGTEIPTLEGSRDNKNALPAIRGWQQFMPTQYERVYPESTQNLNYMIRAKTYKNVLQNPEHAAKILEEESAKMNESIRDAEVRGAE